MLQSLVTLHTRITDGLDKLLDGWFLGAFARFVFAAVLFVYFFNSAMTKFDGPFTIADAAYFQIVPTVVEAYGYDASQVPFFPWGLIVYAGSYAEVFLPILIVVGFLTRLAALGMIGFVLVQSFVDIAFHHVDEATIGGWFDNISGAAIMDQRTLWIFLFVYLVLKGPGRISLDYLLGHKMVEKARAPY